MFPGEGPRLQIFKSVLDGLLPHHLTEGHTWVVHSGEHLPKSFPVSSHVFPDGAAGETQRTSLKGVPAYCRILTRGLAGGTTTFLGFFTTLPDAPPLQSFPMPPAYDAYKYLMVICAVRGKSEQAVPLM